MERPEHAAGSRWAVVPGVLFVLVVVGTLVFAIVAQVTDPPLEPSLTFMRWQALWNDGRYGVKFNFAVTWISTLIAVFGPIALVGLGVGAVRAARTRPAWPADWHPLTWKRMDRGARLRLAVGLTGIAVVFGAVCVVDPSLLSPVGFLAQVGLLVWPFTVIAGPLLLLDELLPERVIVGPVEALEHTPGSQPQAAGEFHVKVGGQRFALPEAPWRRLAVGEPVAVRLSGGLDRVQALAAQRPAPERAPGGPAQSTGSSVD
jgi:hypothetical protein